MSAMKRALRLLAAALATLAILLIAAVAWFYPRWYRSRASMGNDHPHGAVRPAVMPPEAERPELVVLVTLDGVRWQEVFDGVDRVLAARSPSGPIQDARSLLPNIYKLFVDGGVALGHPDAKGSFCTANPHHTSLAGYQELLSARPTSCTSNACGPTTEPTVVGALIRVNARCEDIALVSSWHRVSNAWNSDEQRAVLLSSGREMANACGSTKIESANTEPPLPGAHPEYRRDADTERAALSLLKTTTPRFLHIALGDADEYAHEGDYGGYLRALRQHDAFLGRLHEAVANLNRRAVIIVTTDHGRGRTFSEHALYARRIPLPESDHIWLLASGHGVSAQGFVDLGGDRHLADVGATIAALLGGTMADGHPLCELFAGIPCAPDRPAFRTCSQRY